MFFDNDKILDKLSKCLFTFLAGGAAGIAKAVNDASAAKQQLAERKRHNGAMETIAVGKGLYLKPYKRGMGLHLSPPKNS